jgi:hypothetical protein
MRATDKTIEIECSECNAKIEGVDNMAEHIFGTHKTYSISESTKYARLWADQAYDKLEDDERKYAEAKTEEPRDD